MILNLYDRFKLEISVDDISSKHKEKIINILEKYQWEFESKENISNMKNEILYLFNKEVRRQKIIKLNELT
jgi:hypothetical protein